MPPSEEFRHQPVEEELDHIASVLGGQRNQQPVQAELLEIIISLQAISHAETSTASVLAVQSQELKALAAQMNNFASSLAMISNKLDTVIQAVIPPTETVNIEFGAPTPKKLT